MKKLILLGMIGIAALSFTQTRNELEKQIEQTVERVDVRYGDAYSDLLDMITVGSDKNKILNQAELVEGVIEANNVELNKTLWNSDDVQFNLRAIELQHKMMRITALEYDEIESIKAFEKHPTKANRDAWHQKETATRDAFRDYVRVYTILRKTN